MKAYTKYDADTGEIICTIWGNNADAQANAPCVSGEYSASEYRVVDGIPVRKGEAEIYEAEINFAWSQLRSQRARLLSACDWTQVPDAPVDQAAWAAYRQELRDLPSKTEDPRNPAWPTPPA